MPKVRKHLAFILTAGLVTVAACSRHPEEGGRSPSRSQSAPEAVGGIPRAQDRRVELFRQEQETDRRLMVRSAPPGFRGRDGGPRLDVRIYSPTPTIRAGSGLRLKLEFQNMGSDPFDYMKMDSLMKSRSAIDGHYWRFFVQGPDGVKRELRPPVALDHGEGDDAGNSPVLESDAANAEMRRFLRVTLGPGETLSSFLRSGPFPPERVPADEDRFVEVAGAGAFGLPGTYKVTAEFRASARNPKTQDEEPEEVYRSNAIPIEVLP